MKPTNVLVAVILATVALIGQGITEAKAQNGISYVSIPGLDSNACDIPATACRTFAGALAKTYDSGTVTCVDAGYFYSATITITVTIDCLAGGGGTNTQQFAINAPGRTVIIRNVALSGLAAGIRLIDITAAASVRLENVLLTATGAGTAAIIDRRSGSGFLYIHNSTIDHNLGPGIVVAPASGTVSAVFDNVHATGNTYGLAVGNGGRVMVKHSVFAGNSTAGVEADSGAYIALNDVMVEGNTTGIIATNGSHIAISNCDIDSNNTAIFGNVLTYGNNRIFANLGDGTSLVPVGSPSGENGLK
jgi:hypothetical protein